MLKGRCSGVFDYRSVKPNATMLFYSFFKTLTGKEVTVELKNDLSITGKLHSVDQYLNVKLNDIKVSDEAKHPHLVRRAPENRRARPDEPHPPVMSAAGVVRFCRRSRFAD